MYIKRKPNGELSHLSCGPMIFSKYCTFSFQSFLSVSNKIFTIPKLSVFVTSNPLHALMGLEGFSRNRSCIFCCIGSGQTSLDCTMMFLSSSSKLK
jgi:hypothetical protein